MAPLRPPCARARVFAAARMTRASRHARPQPPRTVRARVSRGERAKLRRPAPYCRECHLEDDALLACSLCLGSYHRGCLDAAAVAAADAVGANWSCPRCVEGRVSARARARQLLSSLSGSPRSTSAWCVSRKGLSRQQGRLMRSLRAPGRAAGRSATRVVSHARAAARGPSAHSTPAACARAPAATRRCWAACCAPRRLTRDPACHRAR